MKKILAAGLASLLMLSSFSGCGSPASSAVEGSQGGSDAATVSVNKTGFPIVEEQQTLTALVVSEYPDVPPEEIVLINKIAEETNVKVEYEVISKTAWAEQKGLVLSRSELPDVIIGDMNFTDADMLQLAEGGRIVPLNEYSEYTENFNSLLEQDPTLAKALTAADGNIWAFPNYISTAIPEGVEVLGNFTTQFPYYINQTWLDNLGLDMPTTTEEFEAVLLAFKTQDPNGNGIADEIPMTGAESTRYFDDMFGAFGLDPHANANEVVLNNIGLKDGKVIFSPLQPEYQEAIAYFNGLWAQGLLDPETFSQDAAMYKAKVQSPERTVGVLSGWRTITWRVPGSEDNTEYSVLPTLNKEDGGVFHKYFMGVRNRSAMMITTDCENPELAMRWADNLIALDNGYQFWTGQKIGYNIEENAEGTFDWIKPIDRDDPEFLRQICYGYGITCVGLDNRVRQPADTDPLGVNLEKDYADTFYEDSFPADDCIYPKTFLTPEESEVVTRIGSEIDLYVEQCYAKWITNGATESDWAKFEEQLNKMGLEEYLGAFQSAYDRYMA